MEQVREVWTKSFRPDPVQVSSEDAPDELEEGSAGKERANEDDFQREMRLQDKADVRSAANRASARSSDLGPALLTDA